MEWVPAARPEVENVARPLLTDPLPSVVDPSKNVTTPVAVEDETVAVNVTSCPELDGLRLDARLVLVVVLVEVFTVCISVPEMLPLKLLSPLKLAWMEWLPTLRLEVERVAMPPLRVALPMFVSPSKKLTIPLAVAGVTLAVRVTNCPELDGLRLEARLVLVALLAPPVFTVCVRVGEALPL